jgi:hypothetical protein
LTALPFTLHPTAKLRPLDGKGLAREKRLEANAPKLTSERAELLASCFTAAAIGVLLGLAFALVPTI